MAETVIGKAIELVFEYTVVPVARQLKYVFCYKSCVEEMNDARIKMQNEKEIVDRAKSAAKNDMQLIFKKTDDWLEDVTRIQEEVSSLLTNGEEKAKNGCSIGGQILNPIARHQLGRKATKKKQAIDDLCQLRPKPEEIAYPPPPPGIVCAEDYAVVRAKQQAEGIFQTSGWEDIMEKIMTSLKDDKINVIGLHGMGGVGKSTMISEVYDRVKRQGMFDEVAKVEVKAKPEIRRIQEEIAFALGLKYENESSTIRAQQLSQRLLAKDEKDEKDGTNQKKKKTILIILDDLWEKLELQSVGIPSVGNDQVQIKLLLTSRDEHLLSDRMGARDPIHLDVLSDADALRMFKFFVGDEAEDIEPEKVSETARKCSGLPIVIEVTAKALKNRALGEWEKILKRLDRVEVLEKLKVSYDYLPSKESKDLFLLCGIIRGPRIPVRDLLMYSFSLGLYEGREDMQTLADAESELEELLLSLEAASMLLKTENSLYVNIHDHMRDLAVWIVGTDRLEWVHFTLRDDNYKLPRKFEASKLELLQSCCEEESSLQVPHSFFKDMKKLYVLNFTNLRAALPSSTDLLHQLGNLATLCLHNCSLDDISMIGELKGLQILSFRGSDIRKLPIQIRGLSALKMLDLSDCKELTQIEPNVLGSLTKLEELNMESSFKNWEIDEEDDARPPSNARLVELKNLSRLSNVWLNIPSTSMLPKDDELFLSKLSIYKIILGDVDQEDQHYIIDAYRKVMMLNFDDSPDVLNRVWVQATLQKTEVLVLNGSLDGQLRSIDEVSPKGFECLKHLRVRKCPTIQYIVSSNCGSNYMNLETLYLERLENLDKLYVGLLGKETFSKLTVIKVNFCHKLTHLFDFSLLKCNSELEEISVHNCDEIHSIVIDEDDMKDDVVVKLLKLQRLILKNIPSFSSFCIPQGPQPSINNVLLSGKKVALPCLESLHIYELSQLEYIWHPTDPPTEVRVLRSLEVAYCNHLVGVINSNVFKILQNSLESLYISNCASIQHVFDLRYEVLVGGGCFQLLKEISIVGCDNMETIIVVMMTREETQQAPIEFSSLKNLQLERCKTLKTFCWYSVQQVEDMSVSGQVPVDLSLFSQKVALPCLESLSIYELSQLEYIWHPTDPPTEVRVLRSLEVAYCNNLVGVINSNVFKILQNSLESLHISNCASIQHVFDLRYEVLVGGGCFQLLKEISIIGCDNMEAIIVVMMTREETQQAPIEFSSLKNLQLDRCITLKTFCWYSVQQVEDMSVSGQVPVDLSLFSQKVTLPCLESLSIYELSQLEYIWHPTDPPTEVRVLRSLEVAYCNHLVGVINSNVFKILQNSLEFFYISNCASIQHVFDLRYEVLVGGGCFQLLKEISIVGCDNMEAIIVVMMTREETQQAPIEFSSLKNLQIERCKTLKTFCWYSVQQVEDMSVSGQVPVDLSLFSQKVTFSCLEYLTIEGLELEYIWHPTDPPIEVEVLRSLKVTDCNNLVGVINSNVFTRLQNSLESLDISNCASIKHVFDLRYEVLVGGGCFQLLKEISIVGCDNMEAIIVLMMTREETQQAPIEYSSLKELHLWSCSKLKAFCWYSVQQVEDMCVSKQTPIDLPFFSQKDSFPCLKTLAFGSLGELRQICPHEVVAGKTSFYNLKHVEICNCATLIEVFPSTLIDNEKNIKSTLDSNSSTNQAQLVNTCSVIEQFLILLEKEILSSLRSFKTSCEDGIIVEMIVDEHDMRLGQKQHLHLTLWECNSSPSCMNLLPLTSPLFCNVLTRLSVVWSNGLEYLFTPVGVTSLVHLTYLAVERCGHIKEIVVREVEDADNGNGSAGDVCEVTFKHLKELTLLWLDNLESFFSSGKSFDLNFPLLEKLVIYGCPKMRSFSTATLTTPKLQQLNCDRWDGEDQSQLLEDLNTIIQKKYASTSSS